MYSGSRQRRDLPQLWDMLALKHFRHRYARRRKRVGFHEVGWGRVGGLTFLIYSL